MLAYDNSNILKILLKLQLIVRKKTAKHISVSKHNYSVYCNTQYLKKY